MSIATLCRRDVITVPADASLREAANRMREHHVGALVVTVEGGGHERVVGLLTDRDLAIEVLTRDLNPADVMVAKVGRIASRHLASVPVTASIAQAVAVMRDAGVRRLLVTAERGELAGIVSADDLLEALAQQLGGLASALRMGIAHEGSERASISPVRPRPVFLPMGTPGMQEPITAG